MRAALEAASIAVESADLEMVATTRVEVTNETGAKHVLKLIDMLEEHDDVQNVWSNVEIPDEILDSLDF
jgi:transcriptional/translational regulatory protein YebC/TACO1